MLRSGIWKTSSQLIKRGVLSTVTLIGSSVFGLTYYAKHSIMLSYYKNSLTLQRKNGVNEPTERLKNLVNEVSKEVEDFASKYTNIVPFITPGLNTLHAGTCGTMQGGIIGLPIFFEFNNKEDIDSNIKVNKMEIDGAEIDVEEFYNCILLSDSAKKYAIAREILLINTSQVYFDVIMPFSIAFVMDAISCNLANHLGVIKFPLLMRCLFYATITAVGLYIWMFLHNNIKNYYESEVELCIIKVSGEYLNGGVEYNSKAIKRNSFAIELKDQNIRILKTLDDWMCSFISYNEISMSSKLAFLEAHLAAANKEFDL